MSQNHVAYLGSQAPTGRIDHRELAECFDDIRDFETLMQELAEFAEGVTKPEQLREFLESKLQFLAEERAGESA